MNKSDKLIKYMKEVIRLIKLKQVPPLKKRFIYKRPSIEYTKKYYEKNRADILKHHRDIRDHTNEVRNKRRRAQRALGLKITS